MADIPWDELMDAAAGSDFAPIPQGDYDVKIIETEATKSSTDKPMWKVTCQVMNGPHEGRKIWTQQTLTMDNEDALNVFFRQMAAAGLTGEFFRTKPTNERIAEALMGRQFRAKVTIREWQGVPRNNIKQWNPMGARGGAPGGPPPPAAGAGGPGGPPPPPAASTPPPAASPPPPAAAAPSPAAATPPPAAAAPPPAAAPAAPAAAQPPPVPPAAPAPTPAPSEPSNGTSAAQEPQHAAASAGGGGGDPWIVQERPTGSTEPPPF
jgi:hypothetical protein